MRIDWFNAAAWGGAILLGVGSWGVAGWMLYRLLR